MAFCNKCGRLIEDGKTLCPRCNDLLYATKSPTVTNNTDMYIARNRLLFVSGVIGSAYAFVPLLGIIMKYMSAGFFGRLLIESVYQGYVPHVVCVIIAAVFNWLGYLKKVTWGALVAGIMYSVATVLGLYSVLFMAPCIALSFIAFSQMKKGTGSVGKSPFDV